MNKRRYLTCAGLALTTALPAVQGQQLQETIQLQESVSDTITITAPAKTSTPRPLPTAPIQDAYILGPGDAVVVELLDVPEYSGVFTIGPDGTLYLPRLRSLFVEGLTVEELRYFLTQQSAPTCAIPRCS